MAVIAIPSYNDPKSLIKCVKKIKETSPNSKIYVVEQKSKTDVDVDKYVHYPEPLGVGKARQMVTEYIMKDYPNEIIIHMDDNTYVNKGSIDKLESAMINNKEFAYIGDCSGFKRWMISGGMSLEDLNSKIHFCPHVGGYFSAINPEFIKLYGHFSNMIVREDVELCAKAWANGWWVGMINAGISHTRGTKARTEEHPFHPKSKEMVTANEMISMKYPDHFKATKDGKLRRTFKFPDKTYRI